MKRKLAIVLMLSILIAAFSIVPAMAADATVVTNYAELKAAIENPDIPVIQVQTFTWGSNPTIVIDREVTILGSGGEWTDLNWAPNTSPAAGFNGQKHFRVTENGVVTLNGLTLQGNASSYQRGGIEVIGGTLTMINSKICFCGHSAGYANGPVAGAILVDGGTVVMDGCKIENGYTSSTSNSYRSSGILVINGAELIISNTSFTSNQLVNSSYSNSNPSIQADDTAAVWFGDNVTFSPGSASDAYAKRGNGVTSWNHADDILEANLLANRPVPADPMNALGVSGSRAVELGAADFSFDALLQLDNVNLIEAEFSYDASEFYVEAVAVPEGLTVNKVDVWGADGKVTVVLGVQGKDGAFAPEELASLVSFTMRPIDGKPETATLTLTSAKLYAKGEIVEYELLDGSYTVTLNYRAAEDVNDDGVIDAADLSVALYYFGAVEADDDWDEAVFSDVNGDGEVDMLDISLLIEAIYG